MPANDVTTSMADVFDSVAVQLAAQSATAWENSPHRWLLDLPSRRRGKAGELIVEGWLTSLGFDVTRSNHSGADRTVNGQPVEVKMSTRWESGQFVWQQIRDQDYTHIILLGVEPHQVRLWVVPKAIIVAHARPQHTGAQGVDTLWLSIDADHPPEWMTPHGGPLNAVIGPLQHAFPTPS